MALRTFHIGMLALKGELGCAVIKLGIFPVFFVVALGALFTQRPFVFIVLLMPPIALQWCLAVALICRMALLTSQGLVLVFQYKISVRVVKRFLVKTCNLCVSAFVIGMADIAGLWFERAMETRFVLHVSPNVLVTRRAQS